MRKKALVPALCLAFAAVLILFPEMSSAAALDSLKAAVAGVIPSLFPYMVISSLIASCGAAQLLGRLIPAAKIFTLPRCAGATILLGALCGFPLGAQSAAELYHRGELSKKETECLISAANNTGPSFLVGVVGVGYLGSAAAGWVLYAAQLISVVIAYHLINRLLFPPEKSAPAPSVSPAPEPFFPALSLAVRNSAVACVYICGFIVFFSVIIGLLSPLPPYSKAAVASILEFSSACRLSCSLGGVPGALFCGFAVGWSGISVFCQSCAFCAPLGLSLRRAVAVKLTQGILCAALFGAAVRLIPVFRSTPAVAAAAFPAAPLFRLVPLGICVSSLIILAVFRRKKRKNSKYA